MQATGEDSDRLVHDVLIRFCAAFLDQGFASWSLPEREKGFYHAFCKLYGKLAGPPDAWLSGLRGELARLDQAKLTPLESIEESLSLLGVPEQEWETFLTSTLLALRGWGGMIRQMEIRADRAAHPVPPDLSAYANLWLQAQDADLRAAEAILLAQVADDPNAEAAHMQTAGVELTRRDQLRSAAQYSFTRQLAIDLHSGGA